MKTAPPDQPAVRRGGRRRSRDWNEGLAAIAEGVPIQMALGKVVRAMGVKEFAAQVKMASPNVLRANSPRHNPTQDTLNRLLKAFRLKLGLARIDVPRGDHAA